MNALFIGHKCEYGQWRNGPTNIKVKNLSAAVWAAQADTDRWAAASHVSYDVIVKNPQSTSHKQHVTTSNMLHYSVTYWEK